MSDEPTDERTFETYGLRIGLEELIRDAKCGGFGMHASMVGDAHMLERLMLVLAATTWVLVNQGVAVVKKGKRRLVDLHWHRGYSYFRSRWGQTRNRRWPLAGNGNNLIGSNSLDSHMRFEM